MHVAILAGGRGVRLRPYTTAFPKPLVPIGEEYAILDIILQQLGSQGFTRVTLAIGHLGSLIRAFVGDGSRWNLAVDYAEEEKPLTIATYQREVKIDFGTLETEDGHIVRFREKPTLHYAVSMGVYAMSRRTL